MGASQYTMGLLLGKQTRHDNYLGVPRRGGAIVSS